MEQPPYKVCESGFGDICLKGDCYGKTVLQTLEIMDNAVSMETPVGLGAVINLTFYP
jgi:hypothetical protein